MYRNLPTLLYRCMKQIQCSPYEWFVLYMNNVIKGQSAKELQENGQFSTAIFL